MTEGYVVTVVIVAKTKQAGACILFIVLAPRHKFTYNSQNKRLFTQISNAEAKWMSQQR